MRSLPLQGDTDSRVPLRKGKLAAQDAVLFLKLSDLEIERLEPWIGERQVKHLLRIKAS